MKKFLFTLILSITFLAQASYTPIENKATIPLLTPSFAQQKVLKIQLDNGLEAYLVSDPEATKSGAALTVQVGSWDEPEEHPGLAHYLEHLLFLGTEQYPDESEYERYITENGGITNAFTTNDATSYLFTVENSGFEGALDRFSSFFHSPKFDPSGIARELNAIDQEYAKNLDNDQIRAMFVLKNLANPKHPYYRFNMGNSKTLSEVKREELIDWYKNHYSAHLMKLVVVSTLPIEEIRDLVVEKFSKIPTTNYESTSIDFRALTHQGHYVYVEPIQNKRTLLLVWELPRELVDTIDTKPDQLVCHVIGHEGEESLLAQLKRENLAEELRCGSVKAGPDLKEFYIEIDLTKAGLKDVETVITRCFQAIDYLQEEGYPRYLFDELQRMAMIRYNYQTRENEFYSLMKHARAITEENLESYPEKTYIPQRFDPDTVHRLLSSLRANNMIAVIIAPSSQTGVPLEKTEPWLNVPYAVKPIPDNHIAKWKGVTEHENIRVPSENAFIPNNLALLDDLPHSEKELVPTPIKIVDDHYMEIYYAPDRDFMLPKVSWQFMIRTPSIDMTDAKKIVMGDLYVKCIKDQLNPVSYNANIADLDFEIERKENGIKISIEGYSDNADALFRVILQKLKNVECSNELFQIYKDTLLRKYQNFAKEGSLDQASEMLKKSIYKHYVTEKEKASALRKITYKRFQDYIEGLFKQTFVEGVIYGNINERQAKNLTRVISIELNSESYPKVEHEEPEIIVLPEESGPFYLENKGSAQGNSTILLVESVPYSFKKRAAQQILMQAIKEPFFATLRTKQQTGYIVFSGAEEKKRNLFNLFAVQSNTHEPRDLLARFELFIESYLQELPMDKKGKEQFETIQQALVETLKKPAKNVKEMGDLLFLLGFDYEGSFDWIEKRIKAMQELTYEEYLEYVQELLGKENRRRLGILFKGKIPEQNEFSYKRAGSIATLKKQSHYGH